MNGREERKILQYEHGESTTDIEEMKEEEFDDQVEEFVGTIENGGTSVDRDTRVLSYPNAGETGQYSPGEKIRQSKMKQDEYVSEKQKGREHVKEGLSDLFVNFAEFS